MTKKIFNSIMLIAAAVLLVSVVTIMGFLYNYFGNVQENQLRDEVELAAVAVENSGEAYLEGLKAERYRLTWVASDGTVIYDTLVDASSLENHGDREEISEAMNTGKGESIRYSSTFLEKTIYVAKRLTDGSVLRLSISSATVGVLALGMLTPILIVLVIALILALIFASRISKKIVDPLNKIDLDKPLENETYEEISPLLTRLNSQQQEITKQLRQLQHQQDEFSQITGSMKEGLVLLDAKNKIISINPKAQTLFATDNSCVGKDFLMIEHSSDINRAMELAIADGYSETRVERDGCIYQFDISRIESAGDVIGSVLLAFDVTEQEFAERNRREFTANVSHELKTPLQSIIGSAELIENNMVKKNDMPRFVGHIREEATRLVALIEDIIRLSQLDEGEELPEEKVDLLLLAQEVTGELSAVASKKKIQLTINGDTVIVKGVKRLLYEIIFNLCDNAIKYNVENGKVDIKVTSEGKNAIVCVKDTGIGIPLENQSHVFERFYRVDKSHSKAFGGTGLGLSIVKHAVSYHHGKIDLQSEKGKGTTITVSLPKA